MLADLAKCAGVTEAEFRARLNDAQIGASGHGLSWEGRARALADQIRKENQGVLPGAVVVPVYEDGAKAIAAADALRVRLGVMFANLAYAGFDNQAQWYAAKATPYRVWVSREPHRDPQGSYEYMGWAVHMGFPSDVHPIIRRLIDSLPIQIDGFDLFAQFEAPSDQPWS